MGELRTAALAVALLAACGEDGPPPDLVADLTRLQEAIAEDPAEEALDAVDAIADDRPVHAARLMRTGAIPAAQRQLDEVEALEMGTPEGRRFARRAVRAYTARQRALESYEDVLDQGISADPLDTLRAIRARREAEEQLLQVMRDVGEVIGVEPRPPSPPGPDEELEGEGEGALEGAMEGAIEGEPGPAP